MDNVDEQSVKEYRDRQEIISGVIKWLKIRSYDSYSTGDLIEELELCGSNGEFPWEVIEDI